MQIVIVEHRADRYRAARWVGTEAEAQAFAARRVARGCTCWVEVHPAGVVLS